MSEHEAIVRRQGDENFHPLSEVFPLLEPHELLIPAMSLGHSEIMSLAVPA